MNKLLFSSLVCVLLYSCRPIEKTPPPPPKMSFIDSLISTMTIEEKVGQMTQFTITTILQDSIIENYSERKAMVIDTNKVAHLIKKYHIGSFLNGRAFTPENWYMYAKALQETNLRHSNIPIIYGIDHVHGSSYLQWGTIFPHNINIANTFDTVYAYHSNAVAVNETRDLGHHWVFSPVLGIGKQKMWGRYYETFGEDPYLIEKMGVAAINGIQHTRNTAACAKHFIGYSDPKSGWDRSPAEIPDQHLREFFLPPFQAAIKAGVHTMMINSGEVNGIPVHASYDILTKLLREELGFKGVAVTDWMDIKALVSMHHVAENEKEATFMAIQAGIDMSMVPEDTSFCIYLTELVKEGRISEERINQSVKRILRLKKRIGLFKYPYPRNDRFHRVRSEKNVEKALNAARESIVLLKNKNNILPLTLDTKMMVGGPCIHKKAPLAGGWTYRFAANGEHWFPKDMPTIYQHLKKDFLSVKNIQNNKFNKSADVIVLAIGETKPYAETDGTIDDLTLEQEQQKTIEAALKTRKPVILILVEGRPRIIHQYADKVDAILFAGLPGNEGAQAISEILSGLTNPSGKMSFTYPRKHGHMIAYNHKPSEYSEIREVSDDLKYYTIGGFGAGLSYSNFEYSDIKADTVLQEGGKLNCEITVKNTSDADGKEAVLWMISDEVGSITRPVKELRCFEKRMIRSGEKEVFKFTVQPERDLSFPDKNGKVILEKGWFTLSVGTQKHRFYFSKKDK